MSLGRTEQIERWPELDFKKSYQEKTSSSRKIVKKMKHKSERQRVRININCFSNYGKYHGWEY